MLLLKLLGASWLGHGRASELALALVLGLSGTLLFITPQGVWLSQLTLDIAYAGYGNYVAYPPLLTAAIKISGLVLNVRGYVLSQPVRFLGAFLAWFLWAWFCIKFFLLTGHQTPTLGLAQAIALSCAIVGVLFSTRIMFMAAAGLPVPGSPGRL